MNLDTRYFTADRVEIKDGLIVWDYDLKLSQVKVEGTRADPTDENHEWWDGWFDMRDPTTGDRMSVMNGERMTTVHPYTRESAEKRWQSDTNIAIAQDDPRTVEAMAKRYPALYVRYEDKS